MASWATVAKQATPSSNQAATQIDGMHVAEASQMAAPTEDQRKVEHRAVSGLAARAQFAHAEIGHAGQHA
jgi:hypothetical protein